MSEKQERVEMWKREMETRNEMKKNPDVSRLVSQGLLVFTRYHGALFRTFFDTLVHTFVFVQFPVV